MVDDLRDDDKGVVIAAWPFSDDPYTRAERLDVYSGRRVVVARAPVQNAEFVTDGSGDVRFAYGAGSDNANKLYYRDGRGSEWRLINDERLRHRREWPLGEIGRASGWERVCQLGYISVGAVSLKKKKTKQHNK